MRGDAPLTGLRMLRTGELITCLLESDIDVILDRFTMDLAVRPKTPKASSLLKYLYPNLMLRWADMTLYIYSRWYVEEFRN